MSEQKTPTSRWEDVDPITAAKYLETMNGNRAVRQQRIDLFAAQMKLGLWRLVPQGIIFTEEGNLVDGQHRLWAVIESGCTVRMMVSRGMSPEDVHVLDSGVARTFADAAHYAGWDATAETASLARLMAMGVGARRGQLIPHSVIESWVEFYRDGVDFGLTIRNMTRGVGTKVIPYPVTVVFARAFYSVDHARLLRIGEILRTGIIDSANERAALSLRDQWMTGRIGANELEKYGKTQSAVKAFLEKRAIKRLMETTGDLFPIKPLPPALRFDAKVGKVMKSMPKEPLKAKDKTS